MSLIILENSNFIVKKDLFFFKINQYIITIVYLFIDFVYDDLI